MCIFVELYDGNRRIEEFRICSLFYDLSCSTLHNIREICVPPVQDAQNLGTLTF